MDRTKFAVGRLNYILLGIGVAAIILGFILMTGPSSTETHFEPDIFSFRRIKLAPTISFLGFLFTIVAIMVKPKNNDKE